MPSLSDWLAYQERLHPAAIDMTLERPRTVLRWLGCERPAPLVITVAGTNGKGSSVALLEGILRAAGYRVGAYTSPHLLRYNERIRIDGREADDATLIAAFERVEAARGETSLTYFEFGTLAAFWVFAEAGIDVAVLEVGMGGRLDAVNLVDADGALITAIDVDHAAWLGNDRESIGREKAGILRPQRPAVCSDPNPPATIVDHAASVGAPLTLAGRDYQWREQGAGWEWQSGGHSRSGLPLPALRGRFQLQNAAGVLALLAQLEDLAPVTPTAVREGLLGMRLPGRFQVERGAPTLIYDVAHNPQAAAELAANLAQMPCPGRTLAVAAVLADKDVAGIVAPLTGSVDAWYVAGLSGARGAPSDRLAEALAGQGEVRRFERVADAWRAATTDAGPDDRVVVFGSFYTVAEALSAG